MEDSVRIASATNFFTRKTSPFRFNPFWESDFDRIANTGHWFIADVA